MYGGVSQVMQLLVPAIPVKAWTLVFAAVTLALLLGGGYSRVERIATPAEVIAIGEHFSRSLDELIDTYERKVGPRNGARVVARAWVDAAFKQRLLSNGTKACEELGLDIPALKLVVVENTPQVHNAIVCTLCSCYPRMLLGIPPDGYKSRNYRSRMVREPRTVLSEFGLRVSEETTIKVHDSSADMRYMVLPMRPAGTEGWSEDRLASIVTRDCMIGVAVPAVRLMAR